MNIHVRAVGRLSKMMFIPALVGIVIAVIFEYLPMQHILLALAVGLVLSMIWLFYNWTLDQIRQEDMLKSMMTKNDQAS